jgi:asparagine synthase (glutamine-hydrolysing)
LRAAVLTPADMTPIEVAAGDPIGTDASVPAPLRSAPGDPLAALEAATLPALSRQPCAVAFSGGRDSSVVLAAAARAARGHGLPDPIPVTLRFPDAPRSHEREWQERVVRHLGLGEWETIELGSELSVVGPVVRGVIGRHGLPYPSNAVLIDPVARRAAGGSVLMGIGGDELFVGWRRRRRRVAALPRGLRRLVVQRRHEAMDLPWLRPAGREALREIGARAVAAEPLTFSRHAPQVATLRDMTICERTMAAIAAGHGALLSLPLADRRFLAAVGHAGGRAGWPSRTEAMRALFEGTLPDDILARRDKAEFGEAFWTDAERDFAESWSGGGLDDAIVDAEALKRGWLEGIADYRSTLLMQSALAHTMAAS